MNGTFSRRRRPQGDSASVSQGRHPDGHGHTERLSDPIERPNMTPAEAGWEGHLTLEFSNSSGADCRIYADEGICQLLFFEGDPCETTYQDRAGKYQAQPEQVVIARV